MGGKVFFVSGNEHRSLTGVLVENMLCQRKLDHESPLLVEPKGGFLPAGTVRKKPKERALRSFDYCPDTDITALPAERAKDLPLEGKRMEIRQAEEIFTSFFMYDEVNRKTLPFVALADYIVLVLKHDVYAAGYLYTLMKLLHDEHVQKKVVIILSGVNLIEEAAASFARYRDELAGMLGEKPDIQFGGFFPVDAKYLAHAARQRQPCVKVFPRSPFQGVIKYVNRSLDGLEPFSRDLPFLYSLAKLQKTSQT